MTDRMLHVRTDDYLAAWNERLLIDYLDEAAAKHPDRVAIVDFEHGTDRKIALTFRELRRRVDRIAWSLIGFGVGRRTSYPCSCRTGGTSWRCIWPACGSARRQIR